MVRSSDRPLQAIKYNCNRIGNKKSGLIDQPWLFVSYPPIDLQPAHYYCVNYHISICYQLHWIRLVEQLRAVQAICFICEDKTLCQEREERIGDCRIG